MLNIEKVINQWQGRLGTLYQEAFYQVKFNGVLIGKIKENDRNNRVSYTVSVYEKNNGKFEYSGYGDYPNIISAKRALFNAWNRLPNEFKQTQKAQETQSTATNVKCLPSGEYQFYPTPKEVAGRMYSCVNWGTVKTILEPSAGIGSLVENIEKNSKKRKRTLLQGC